MQPLEVTTLWFSVCRSAGTAFAVSACQAICTAATMTGYSVGSASGDATSANFASGAVTLAAGYTGAVCYTVCGSAGTAYAVSACQATCTAATTIAYCDGSASVDVTIADYAPGGVTCAAGYTWSCVLHGLWIGWYSICGLSVPPTCKAATMSGYSVRSASGDATIASFAPGAVTRAAGYTGAVSYTVCGSAGTAYAVSACRATCTAATTTA